MKESIKRALKSFMVFLNQGKTPYVACCGLIVLGTLLVYFSPRSIPAFLLFVFSASSSSSSFFISRPKFSSKLVIMP